MNLLKHCIITIFIICFTVGCDKKQDDEVLYYISEYVHADSIIEHSPDQALKYIKDFRAAHDNSRLSDIYYEILLTRYYATTNDTAEALKHADKIYPELENISDSNLIGLQAKAYVEQTLGRFNVNSNADTAVYYLEKSVGNYKKLVNIQRIIESYIALAEISKNRNDYYKCLEYLRAIEQSGDTVSTPRSSDTWWLSTCTKIALIASEIGDFRLANNSLMAATRYVDTAKPIEFAHYLLDRSKTHLYQGEYTLSMLSAQRLEAYATQYKMWDLLAAAYTMNGLGRSRLQQYDKATKYAKMAVAIANEHNVPLIKEHLMLEGETSAYNGRVSQARRILFEELPNILGMSKNAIMESQKVFFMVQKNYKEIVMLQQRQVAYNDSIRTNVLNVEENSRLNRDKFYLGQAQERIRQRDKEISRLKSQMWKRDTALIAALIGVTIVMIAYSRRSISKYEKKIKAERQLRRIEIQKKIEELEEQKEILQLANNRISESFTYAQSIQRSILPNPETLNTYPITGSFVFYSPLDIVSGDFYWFMQKKDSLIICCADCTGHGVPGAFMSMIASTILNEICAKGSDDITPAEILEQLDQRILKTLGKNESEEVLHDGLDVSIVSINLKTKEVISSAARRPVIIIKDHKPIYIEGTKRSIGDVEPILNERRFENTVTQLQTGDTVYMYTDGYCDQFGGQEGKKMKNIKVKKFLEAIHDYDMDEQCLTVQELFTQWKADWPQIDDVLFIGVKI